MKTMHLKFIIAISMTTLFVVMIGCQNQTRKVELDKFKSIAQVQNQNKEIVREVFSAIDGNKFDKLNELFSNDFGLKAPGIEIPWKKNDVFQAIKTHYASFPDWTHNIEDMIAEGDKVAVKLTQNGTHKAQYKEISATGKIMTNPAMSIMTIVNGQVKEWWVIEDNLGFMKQLGMELKPVEKKK
jgi:ketosteroid isomerase-like protein